MGRLLVYLVVLLFRNFAQSTKSKALETPLILLSIDGFAYEYLTTYQPKNILSFANSGTSAKLLPVYPSKTFPNHLSIITGRYPAKHGIVHNSFYHPILKEPYRFGAGKNDSKWITAKPIWSIAQENNITSAVYFWPESEMKGQGSSPKYNIPYNTVDTDQARFDQIIHWLKLPKSKAPTFIVSYFSSVDEAGHKFGINSPELAQAVANIDELFGYFIQRLNEEIPQNANVVLLSDHGMLPINTKITEKMVFSEKVESLINDQSIIIARSTTQLYLYFNPDNLNKSQKNEVFQELKNKQSQHSHLYSVYQKPNYPTHWQMNLNIEIIPDIIIEAKPKAIFTTQQYVNSNKATHGYDPLNQEELTTIFFAAGPNIVKNTIIPPFENVHIVPLLTQLLGIQKLDNIDGDYSILAPIYQEK